MNISTENGDDLHCSYSADAYVIIFCSFHLYRSIMRIFPVQYRKDITFAVAWNNIEKGMRENKSQRDVLHLTGFDYISVGNTCICAQ